MRVSQRSFNVADTLADLDRSMQARTLVGARLLVGASLAQTSSISALLLTSAGDAARDAGSLEALENPYWECSRGKA